MVFGVLWHAWHACVATSVFTQLNCSWCIYAYKKAPFEGDLVNTTWYQPVVKRVQKCLTGSLLASTDL